MKGRKRQLSRGSTTSIHSTATHSLHEQQLPGSPTEYQQQWFDNEQRRGYNESMTTDDAMGMQAAARLQNAREYGIDPALGAAVNHTLGIAAEGAYRADSQRQSLPGDGYGTSFVEDDSQMLENRSEEQDDIDSVAGGVGPAKKSGKSTAANELEMRKLFHDNKDRSLPDVASELHGNERGPQSERTRQVFAMLW
jgi:regulatory factor X